MEQSQTPALDQTLLDQTLLELTVCARMLALLFDPINPNQGSKVEKAVLPFGQGREGHYYKINKIYESRK